jgi:hypothetical protein
MASRIDKLVELVLQYVDDDRYSSAFMHLLLTKGRATLDINIGFVVEGSNIHDDLQYYDSSVYSSMNTDKVRNRYFERAIQTHSKKYHRWFEIGPGASAILTHMVLEAHHHNTLFSIEAGHRSVAALEKTFRREPRFTVLQGLAGKVALPVKRPFQAVLAEILGHFASSEGYVAVLHECAEQYPAFSDVKVHIPPIFGTNIVPVDLSRASHLRIAKISDTMIFIDNFPVEDTELSADHGTMEMYNACKEMATRLKRPRTTKNTWHMQRPGHFHGFVCYLVFGDDEDNLITSMECNNWSQIFVAVGKGDLMVRAGDIVKIATTCHVHLTPSYNFDVILERRGKKLHEETLEIGYSDLMSATKTLRSLKKK